MAAIVLEDRIAEIDRKLDYLVEEIASLRRLRNSAEDLAADLSLVGKSAMRDAVEAFGTADLRPQEMVGLVKAVMANAELLHAAMQQLQSAADFIQDAQPILRDAMMKAIAAGENLSRKGYLDAAAASMRVAGSMIEAHSAEDWKQVEQSVPQLVGFLRELTKPEVLEALEAIIFGFGRVQATMNVDKSTLTLVRDLNSVEARRGISVLVEFLKVIGKHAAPSRAANRQ